MGLGLPPPAPTRRSRATVGTGTPGRDPPAVPAAPAPAPGLIQETSERKPYVRSRSAGRAPKGRKLLTFFSAPGPSQGFFPGSGRGCISSREKQEKMYYHVNECDSEACWESPPGAPKIAVVAAWEAAAGWAGAVVPPRLAEELAGSDDLAVCVGQAMRRAVQDCMRVDVREGHTAAVWETSAICALICASNRKGGLIWSAEVHSHQGRAGAARAAYAEAVGRGCLVPPRHG